MAAQLELLNKAGCHEIFKEKVSGSNTDRPELKKLLAYIRKCDTVMVTKLDRLARSTKNWLTVAEAIKKKSASKAVSEVGIKLLKKAGFNSSFYLRSVHKLTVMNRKLMAKP